MILNVRNSLDIVAELAISREGAGKWLVSMIVKAVALRTVSSRTDSSLVTFNSLFPCLIVSVHRMVQLLVALIDLAFSDSSAQGTTLLGLDQLLLVSLKLILSA